LAEKGIDYIAKIFTENKTLVGTIVVCCAILSAGGQSDQVITFIKDISEIAIISGSLVSDIIINLLSLLSAICSVGWNIGEFILYQVVWAPSAAIKLISATGSVATGAVVEGIMTTWHANPIVTIILGYMSKRTVLEFINNLLNLISNKIDRKTKEINDNLIGAIDQVQYSKDYLNSEIPKVLEEIKHLGPEVIKFHLGPLIYLNDIIVKRHDKIKDRRDLRPEITEQLSAIKEQLNEIAQVPGVNFEFPSLGMGGPGGAPVGANSAGPAIPPAGSIAVRATLDNSAVAAPRRFVTRIPSRIPRPISATAAATAAPANSAGPVARTLRRRSQRKQ